MKTTFKLFFLAAIVSIIFSCGKNPYKLLQQKDGTWNATTVTTVTGIDPITSINQITFYVGSATVIDTGGHQSGFNWAYDKKAKQITVTSIAGNDAYNTLYNVSEVTKDAEKWTFVSHNRNDTLLDASNYSQTISLVRK